MNLCSGVRKRRGSFQRPTLNVQRPTLQIAPLPLRHWALSVGRCWPVTGTRNRHNPYSTRTTKCLKFIGSENLALSEAEWVEWVNRLYLFGSRSITGRTGTPNSLRLRKRILDATIRKRAPQSSPSESKRSNSRGITRVASEWRSNFGDYA